MTTYEAQLIDRLYAAFSAAPRPKADDITPHRCEECDAARDLLLPYEPLAVPAPHMERLGDCLPLLSPTALRYYLPRFLEFSITHRNSIACEFLLYHLADENPDEEYWTECYDIFSAAEREVIAEYLRYRTTWPEYEIEEEWVERGLIYWSKDQE